MINCSFQIRKFHLSVLLMPIWLFASIKPTVLIYSGTHGDEKCAHQIVLNFQKEIQNSSLLTAEERDLISRTDIRFITNINPDGLKKNIRFTAAGVDPNRDYGFWWNGEGDSPYPWSQKEVQRVVNDLDQLRISLSVDIHDGMTKLVSPWGALPYGTPDSSVFSGILSRTPIPGFLAERFHRFYKGQFYNMIYQSTGTAQDYIYGNKGAAAFLIETSLQRSVDTGFAKIYADHRPILMQLIRESHAGIIGTAVSNTDGTPLDAVITVIDSKGNRLWPISTDKRDGSFHKITGDGQFSLLIEAEGYRSLFVKSIELKRTVLTRAVLKLVPIKEQCRFAHRISSAFKPELFGKTKHAPFPMLNRTSPSAMIGKPDSRFYSLERNGFAVIDFGRVIQPGEFSHLTVRELGFPEGYRVTVSESLFSKPDHWTLAGKAEGSASIRLPRRPFRYAAITDDGAGMKWKEFSGADIESVLLKKRD